MNSLSLRRAALVAVSSFMLVGCGNSDDSSSPEANRATEAQLSPTAEMKVVQDELGRLGAKTVDLLTVEQARTQPTPADAVRSILTSKGQNTAPEAVASVEDRSFAGPAGSVPIRIYKPSGNGPFPVVLYIHGGGWVIANIDTYDSSARALTNAANAANAANAIVVSTHYRQGPEFKFPAAHDDTYAAYRWTLANAGSFGGNVNRVAVAGESAGGNMAASITVRARNDGVRLPVHQVLIDPLIDATLDSPSEQQNRNAMSLNTASIAWFADKYFANPADGQNPLFTVKNASSAGLPSATIITADIDPLRSEGRAYADQLKQAGVTVDYVNFTGVTHEFFGMGAVLTKAREAVARPGAGLKVAFALAGN